MSATAFQIATWYDTWNKTSCDNLINGTVPLFLASRYNLAFYKLVQDGKNGYTVQNGGRYADEVKLQIRAQTTNTLVYVGLGNIGIIDAVNDNKSNNNRSTANIVAWLKSGGYDGISIDAEDSEVMQVVPAFVTQLGPSFQTAGLGIAISVPWPGTGPTALYGPDAVTAFNTYVDVLELQDYSSYGTPTDAPIWIEAGIPANKLMGGVSTENGGVQTSLDDTRQWTQYALQNGLQGMFSWRLDNDYCIQNLPEDVNPTYRGAWAVFCASNASAIFQLSAVSQNDQGAADGETIYCTIDQIGGGDLRPDSFPIQTPVLLPTPPNPPPPPPPTPTWFLTSTGSLGDTFFLLQISCETDPDYPTTTIPLTGDQVFYWAPWETNQIYSDGIYGIFGYAQFGPYGLIYTVTAGVLDPKVRP